MSGKTRHVLRPCCRVLQVVRAFHRKLSGTCHRLSQRADGEQLKLLTGRVPQNEQRFEVALGRLSLGGRRRARFGHFPTAGRAIFLISARWVDA